LSPPAAVDKEKQNVGEREVDPDVVVMARAYKQDDLDDAMDYKYRTMALFLPQCGVFYCCRERRHEDVGLVNTLIPLDMSWLRLKRETDSNRSVSYTFGKDGYVKRFHRQISLEVILEHNQISAWQISTQRINPDEKFVRQKRRQKVMRPYQKKYNYPVDCAKCDL